MKIKFTKLPTTDGTIKVSLDGGFTFTDYTASDVCESGITLDDNQMFDKIRIKGRANVLSNLEVLKEFKIELSVGEYNYDNSEKRFPDSVKNITVPENTTEIDSSAFYYWKGIESITPPESVRAIGSNAFYCCKNLKSINTENIKTFGASCFEGSGIEHIVIPKGAMICYRAFKGSGLINVTIPYTYYNYLGEEMFMGCSHLESITIQSVPKNIGARAFMGCSSLKVINFNGTEEEWNSLSKGVDWNKGCPSDMVINYNYQG